MQWWLQTLGAPPMIEEQKAAAVWMRARYYRVLPQG
jgi:hypothetical protein